MHYAIWIILAIVGYVIYRKGGITIPKTTISTGDPEVISEIGLPITEGGLGTKFPALTTVDPAVPATLESKKAASDLNVVTSDPIGFNQQIETWLSTYPNMMDVLPTGENVLRAFQAKFPTVKDATVLSVAGVISQPGENIEFKTGIALTPENLQLYGASIGSYRIAITYSPPWKALGPVVAHSEASPVTLVKTVPMPPIESSLPEASKAVFSAPEQQPTPGYWLKLFNEWAATSAGSRTDVDPQGGNFVRKFRAQFPQFTLTSVSVIRLPGTSPLFTVEPHFLGPDGSVVN